ncbi:hypothetical protein H9660_09280 [Clostridium sp. Sa3CUN1]|uniref:Protein containing Zn-finger domain n=1 Tax=Clostridium gallinarum TaxID=2762246 RepID=A0ABR8Q4K2_9CLOT|nr:hypothetical protein [Clostridium gallinarum]MBD7915338.1 hypothetical protein [Clostridium gallinarum]
MNINKYTDDDICDIYPNRICDNCGDCLKEEGIDVRAIKIEDIAKNIEENEFLEAEYKSMLEALKEEQASKLDSEENLEDQGNLEYIDAFDNIEYIDDLDYLEEDFDEATEEVFPGFRILKRKNY